MSPCDLLPLFQIVSCIRQIVSTDSAVEVRRAAIQVFSLMFQGIGSRLLQVGDEMFILAASLSEILRKFHGSNEKL